jgi:hypothetical protein
MRRIWCAPSYLDLLAFETEWFKTKPDPFAGLEAMDQSFRKQLQPAIEAGAERCSVGVSTIPGTKRPIVGYQRSELLAGLCRRVPFSSPPSFRRQGRLAHRTAGAAVTTVKV